MPGKKAPDYFPLNLSMSGIGKGSYYGNASPVLGYGKFDSSGLGMIMGSPMNTLTNNSPNTNAYSLSEYITINGIPPVNSEDEDEDDIVSHSGSESVSIQDSDDLDVDIDDVDSLVLNIRDKLQMAPNGTSSNTTSGFRTPSSGNESSDDLINYHHHCTSPLSFPNTTNSSGDASINRRRRNHPYSHVRSMNFPHRKSNNDSSSSPASTSNKGHNSYYRSFHRNPPGSIGKKSNSHQKNWWASSVAKGCSSSSITKQFSRTDDPYQLLQELLESGSLIKEAVRRLNRKCLNSSNGSNTTTGTSTSNNSTNSNSIPSSVICGSSSNSSSAGTTTNSSSNTRFSFVGDEDTENSYPIRSLSNHV